MNLRGRSKKKKKNRITSLHILKIETVRSILGLGRKEGSNITKLQQRGKGGGKRNIIVGIRQDGTPEIKLYQKEQQKENQEN